MSKSEAEKQLLREYHDKFPDSIAYEQWNDQNVSYEQHHLEFKLEKLVHQAHGIVNERRGLYLKSDEPLALPAPMVLVGAKELREEREKEVEGIENVEKPEGVHVCADVLRDEVMAAAVRMNNVAHFKELLRAFFAERAEMLILKRYKHLVRWARFCTKTSVQERLKPGYQKRLQSIEEEYEDTVARVERLSSKVAIKKEEDPEMMKKKAAQHNDMVTLAPDFRIYMRWLVCHYKSFQKMHRYFKKVQWIPFKSRFDIYVQAQELLSKRAALATDKDHSLRTTAAKTAPFMITRHEFLTESLEDLKHFFSIAVSSSSNDGQEFFYYVNKTFSAVHSRQAKQKYFPVYDSSLIYAKQHGQPETKKPGAANNPPKTPKGGVSSNSHGEHGGGLPAAGEEAQTLEEELESTKEAENVTYLKTATWREFQALHPEVSETAERIRMSLLGVRNIDEYLRNESSFVDSDDAAVVTKRLKNQVETHRIRAASRTARTNPEDSAALSNITMQRAATRLPLLPPHKLLAHYYLQYLRTREFKRRILSTLNYFRSIERKLAIDALGFAEQVKPTSKSHGQKPPRSAAMHLFKDDLVLSRDDVLKMQGLENRDDRYVIDAVTREVRVKDTAGVFVMYDAAIEDFQTLETELLRLGTHFIVKHAPTEDTEVEEGSSAVVDRVTVLADLFEGEMWYQDSKRKLLDCYLEAYENVYDPAEQRKLGQLMVNLMVDRPQIDLSQSYFMDSYASEVISMDLQHRLYREIIQALIEHDRQAMSVVYSKVGSSQTMGLPDGPLTTGSSLHNITLVPGAQSIGVADFCTSLAALTQLATLIKTTTDAIYMLHRPVNFLERSALQRAVLQQALVEWRLMLEEDKLVIQISENSEGMYHIKDSILLEDPTAVELIANELFFEISRPDAGAKADANQGGLLERINKITNTREDVSPAALQVFMNTIDMIRVRKGLLDSLYETEVLSYIYRIQARAMGRDVRKMDLDPINFEEAIIHSETDNEPVIEAPDDEPLQHRTDFNPNFAIAEFEKSMAKFDFQTFAGVKKIIAGGGLPELWHAHRVQITQKNLLIAVIQYNQVTLDQYARKYAEDAAKQVRARTAQGDFSKLFITSMPALPAGGPHDARGGASGGGGGGGGGGAPGAVALDSMSSSVRRTTELKRLRYAEMSKMSKMFVSITAIKSVHRIALLNEFTEQQVWIVKSSKPDAVARKLRELKYELISEFCTKVIEEVYGLALKTQLYNIVQQTGKLLQNIPRETMPFVLGWEDNVGDDDDVLIPGLSSGFDRGGGKKGKDGKDLKGGGAGGGGAGGSGNQSARDRESAFEEEYEGKHIMTSDGRIQNIWYLPDAKEILRMFETSTDPRDVRNGYLWSCLEIVTALHDIVVFVRLQSRMESYATDDQSGAGAGHLGGSSRPGTMGSSIRTMTSGTAGGARTAKSSNSIGLGATLGSRKGGSSNNNNNTGGSSATDASGKTGGGDGTGSMLEGPGFTPDAFAEGSGWTDTLASLESAGHELQKLWAEVRNIGTEAHIPSVIVSFLRQRRDTFFYRLVLSLQNLKTSFLCKQNAAASKLVLRTLDMIKQKRLPLADHTYLAHVPTYFGPDPAPRTRQGNQSGGPQGTQANADATQPYGDASGGGGGGGGGMMLGLGLDEEEGKPAEGVLLRVRTFATPNSSAKPTVSNVSLVSTYGGPFVGCAVPEPFGAWEMFLIGMNRAEMNVVLTEMGNVDLFLEDLLAENKVYRTGQPIRAVALMSQFLEKSITLAHLRDRFYVMHVGPEALVDGAATERARVAYENIIMTKVMTLHLSDANPIVKIDDNGRGGRTESELRSAQILVVRQEIDKMMIVRQTEEMNHKLGSIIVEMERRFQDETLSLSKDAADVELVGRTHLLTEFLQHLLSRVLETRTDENKPAFLMTQSHLVAVIDRFAQQLHEWGNSRLNNRIHQLNLLNQHLNFQLYVREQNISHLEYQLAIERKSLLRRVQVEVADRSHNLILENEDLKSKIALSEKEAARAVHETREEVKKSYEDLIRDLTLQLVLTKSKFKEYRTQVYGDMLASLSEVKKEALMKMVESGPAPLELKRKTWKIARMEEESNKLKEENNELRKTILKLRTIHQLRDIATRATFEKRLRKLTQESASVHKDLWGTKEDTEKKEMLLRKELLTANTHLTAANMELEQLRKDLELQNRNKAALVQWKVSKSQQLTELESKVKKYERWSSVDVDKLLAELGRKDNEIRNLSNLEARAQRQAELNDGNRSRELKRLKQALTQEKKLKEQALIALDSARGARGQPSDLFNDTQASGGGDGYGGGGGGEIDGPITDVYIEAMKEEMAVALRENDIMRSVLQELGLNPPTIKRPGTAQSSQAGGGNTARSGMSSRSGGGPGFNATSGGSAVIPRPPSSSQQSRGGTARSSQGSMTARY